MNRNKRGKRRTIMNMNGTQERSHPRTSPAKGAAASPARPGRAEPPRGWAGRVVGPLGGVVRVAGIMGGLALLVACGSKSGGVVTGTTTGGGSASATSTTGASGTTGATGGQNADMGTGAEVTCEDEVFADTDGEPTGIEVCSNGATFRKEAVACHPRPVDPDFWSCPGPSTLNLCDEDSQCQGFGGSGACIVPAIDEGCTCHYDCQTDADCGPGALCRCGAEMGLGYGDLNRCISATCQSDADCPDGERCLLVAQTSTSGCGGEEVAHCTSPADECSGGADCSPPEYACIYDSSEGRFICSELPTCSL